LSKRVNIQTKNNISDYQEPGLTNKDGRLLLNTSKADIPDRVTTTISDQD